MYEVTIKRVDADSDFVRVISKPFLMGIIEEIANWCNDSEILKRCLASAMMLDINTLSPNCDKLKAKGNLKIDIPPWKVNDDDNQNEVEDKDEDEDVDIESKHNDNDNDNDIGMEMKVDARDIVTETENAFYFLILHDHVLRKQYLPILSNFWYPLITLPPVKHRVSQILSGIYELMCKTYGDTERKSRHQFVGLTVQFFTIDPIAKVCETHGLFTAVIDAFMRLSCPEFAHQLNALNKDKEVMNALQLFATNEAQYKINWDIALNSGTQHIVYDERYLFSVDAMMDYLLFNPNNGGFELFWKRYINMVSTVQNSISYYRRHREHIEYEDRRVINYLRFELNMFFANQRIILNGLYQCMFRHKHKDKDKDTKTITKMETDHNDDNDN